MNTPLLLCSLRFQLATTSKLFHKLLVCCGRSGNCCWPSPVQSFLASVSLRSMTKIFVLSQTCTCFKMGPIFNKEGGQSFCVGAMFVAPWILCHCIVLSNIYTKYTEVSCQWGLVQQIMPYAHCFSLYNLGVDHIENTTSNRSSIVACISIASDSCLLCRCLATAASAHSTLLGFQPSCHNAVARFQIKYDYKWWICL
jgi:hypothetical protein